MQGSRVSQAWLPLLQFPLLSQAQATRFQLTLVSSNLSTSAFFIEWNTRMQLLWRAGSVVSEEMAGWVFCSHPALGSNAQAGGFPLPSGPAFRTRARGWILKPTECFCDTNQGWSTIIMDKMSVFWGDALSIYELVFVILLDKESHSQAER